MSLTGKNRHTRQKMAITHVVYWNIVNGPMTFRNRYFIRITLYKTHPKCKCRKREPTNIMAFDKRTEMVMPKYDKISFRYNTKNQFELTAGHF